MGVNVEDGGDAVVVRLHRHVDLAPMLIFNYKLLCIIIFMEDGLERADRERGGGGV